MLANRMLGSPRNNMTTRSRPMPPPPCGIAPCLKELMYLQRATAGELDMDDRSPLGQHKHSTTRTTESSQAAHQLLLLAW